MGGPYRTILLDPPWLESGGEGRGAQWHYPLMRTDDIIDLVLSSQSWNPAEDAHMYLWVTNNFLRDGLRCMEAWGFRYLNNVAWVKMRNGRMQTGIGRYFRGSHELMLFGVRGNGMAPEVYTTHRNVESAFYAPRTVHSRKPDGSYALIEARSKGPRVEFFSRTARPGWDAWGNQAESQPAAIQERLPLGAA